MRTGPSAGARQGRGCSRPGRGNASPGTAAPGRRGRRRRSVQRDARPSPSAAKRRPLKETLGERPGKPGSIPAASGDDGLPHGGAGGVTFRAMEASGETRRGRRALRFGALVVLALAAAVGIWLFVRDRNQDNRSTPTAPMTTGGRSSVVRASQQAL